MLCSSVHVDRPSSSTSGGQSDGGGGGGGAVAVLGFLPADFIIDTHAADEVQVRHLKRSIYDCSSAFVEILTAFHRGPARLLGRAWVPAHLGCSCHLPRRMLDHWEMGNASARLPLVLTTDAAPGLPHQQICRQTGIDLSVSY